ncbi:unnamed protein product [Closterium sp. NIES-54]
MKRAVAAGADVYAVDIAMVEEAEQPSDFQKLLAAGPAPSGVSHVDPPPLVEPLEISYESFGPAKGGDPAADDSAATRRSPHLETPPAETAGAEPGGAETEGEGSGGAATRGAGSGGAGSGGAAIGGADSRGAAISCGGGAVGDPVGGPRAGQPPQPDLLEMLSPQAIRAWIVRRGSPGGGGYGHAGAGAASPGGTAGVGGTGGTAGGAAGAGGTRGAASAGGAGATSPRDAIGAGGAGPTSHGGTAGAGGVGGAAGAGGAGAGGTGGDGAAGPGGARPGGAGAAGAGGAVRAGGATGAAGTGSTGGTAGAGGARGVGAGGAAGAGGARGATGAAGNVGAGGTAGAGGVGAGGTGGIGGVGAAGPGGARTGGAGAAGAGGPAGAGGAGGAAGATGTRGARGTTGAKGPGAVGARDAAGAGGAGGSTGAAGAGAAGSAAKRLFFYPQPQSSLPPPDSVLCHVLCLPSSTGLSPPLLCSQTDQSPPQLLPNSSLPAPACHIEVTESLTKRREPETRTSTPVRARRVARPRPPAVTGTHGMALRSSSVPHRVVLLEPPASSLSHVPDPESDLAHAASPTVTRLFATVVIDPDLESTVAFALVTELVDFAARSRLDYVASLVTESESVCPPSVGGEPALSSDVLEDRQFELECLAAALPRFASMLLCPEGDPDALDIPTPRSYEEAIADKYSSEWQIAMDAKMASSKSTGTYVDEVPPPRANIVDGMWIFRLKRPPGSSPAFKARYVARGFSQRQGVEFFQTFSHTPKMTTLWVLLHVAAQRDYELHSFDYSTALLQGSLHEEIWLCRPPGFTGSFPADDLVFATADTEALALVLQRFNFQFSSPQPTPLSISHSLSVPPLDESVDPSGPYPELVGCLMYLMTCTRPNLAYPLSLMDRYVAPGQGLVVLTAHSDASWADDQELRWLTYVLTDLGERPRSLPVLYVDNRAMLALCHEQRLEHITKHIALRYFLAREVQQHRHLRLSYVASQANTADVFTKALGSGDHQRFYIALGLVPTLPLLLVA